MNTAIKLTNIDAEIARLIIAKAAPDRRDDLLLRLAFISGFDNFITENESLEDRVLNAASCSPEGSFGDLMNHDDIALVGYDNRIAIEEDDPNCVIVTLEPIDNPEE